MKIWLASASPRRKQLLEWSGYACDIYPQEIDESQRPGEEPIPYVLRMAAEKAAGGPPNRVVLAADTIVHKDTAIYGKPVDRADALRILSILSGSWHTVTTSVCLRYTSDRHLFAVDTAVRFRTLSTTEISAYVDSGEADDKAGAYGIQGRAGAFVAELRGSWTNVMGLPVEAVVQHLNKWRKE